MARTAATVKSKAARKVNEVSKSPEAREVESRVIELAEQIGRLAGTVRYKADTLIDNETLKEQMTRIRDGASSILEQVNRAGSAAGESAMRLATVAKTAAKEALPGAAARKAEAAKTAAADAKRQQSRKPVAAPGKKHRKPPPQVKVDRHASKPATRGLVMKPTPRQGQR